MSPYRQQTGMQNGDIELVFLSDVAVLQTDDPSSRGDNTNVFLDAREGGAQSHATADGQGADEVDISDIYRGGTPLGRHIALDVDEESSSASTSSSSSLNVGRRLGALAAVVEQAISRWARAHYASSSSTSTSTSSSSSRSVLASTRIFRRRRRDTRASSISLQTTLTEQAIIARKKAREETRFVPRQFVLLIPTNLTSPTNKPKSYGNKSASASQVGRITTTSSLQEVLGLLELALKSSARPKKTQAKTSEAIGPDASFVTAVPQKKGKGKSRRANVAVRENLPRRLAPSTESSFANATAGNKGWWLDVSSPSWEDMRALGKLLRLHPLTLEDILHEDPREKLEVFPRLGYYFVVIRALEGDKSRMRFRRHHAQENDGASSFTIGPADEGVIGAVNVYLVVFREGICSFHFEDISEHTDRIRNKILQLEDSVNMPSDWIAHGIIDSIVDSFFPILGAIEREVENVDSFVLQTSTDDGSILEPTLPSLETKTGPEATGSDDGQLVHGLSDRKYSSIWPSSSRLSFMTAPSASAFPVIQKIQQLLKRRGRSRSHFGERSDKNDRMLSSASRTLIRIAAMRRIVTSLGRLLGTKGEVVAQMRKRHLSVLGASLTDTNAGEFAVHMGDIQDHILTLQQSLVHYERMLSHSHPAYLSQLRVSQSNARGDTDKAILGLTVVSIIVLCIQLVLGCFSMNVKQPRTEEDFTVFLLILAGATLLVVVVLLLVRYWKYGAKRKYRWKM